MEKFLIIIFLISLVSCNLNNTKDKTNDKIVNNNTVDTIKELQVDEKSTEDQKGFLFIDISKIYHHNKEFNILGEDNKTLAFFKNKYVTINDKSFEIIEDLKSYKESIQSEFLYPEYGLFIVKCDGFRDGNYVVEINGKKALINKNIYNDLLTFKTSEKYILEAYPVVSINHPIRKNPNDNAEIIKGFEKYTYVSIEIRGDWLKVKDDKDCYPGTEPSKEDITGWVRWREDGIIIIDVAHSC